MAPRFFAPGAVLLGDAAHPVGRWFRDLAVRLTPASVNDRALRRILSDMPGVPLERTAAVGM